MTNTSEIEPFFIRKEKLRRIYSQDIFLKGKIHAGSEQDNDLIPDITFSQKESYLDRLYAIYCQDESFREKINDYHLYGKTKNAKLKKIFEQVIKNKENLIFEVNALRRQGKSTLARALVLKYCKMQKKNARFFMVLNPRKLDAFLDIILDKEFQGNPEEPAWKGICVYVTFSFQDTEEIAKTVFQQGDFILQDETPKETGKGRDKTKDKIDNLFNIASGKRQINCALLNPYTRVLHEVDYYLMVLGINRQHKATLAMLFTTLFENGKFKKFIWIGVVRVNAEEPEMLTNFYEETSNTIKGSVQEFGGITAGAVVTKGFYIKLLLDTIDKKKAKITTRRELESFAREIPAIKGYSLFDDVITDVHRELKQKRNVVTFDDSQVIEAPEFSINEQELLKDYPKERDAFIYQEYKSGLKTQGQIGLDYKVTQGAIWYIVKQVKGWLSDRIGKLFEKFRANAIQNEIGKDGQVNWLGEKGKDKPDIEVIYQDGRIEFVSCKCYESDRTTISIPLDEFDPEINATKAKIEQGQKATCLINLYHLNNKNLYIRTLDITNLPKRVSFRLIQPLPAGNEKKQ